MTDTASERTGLLYKANAIEGTERLTMLMNRQGQDRIFARMETPNRTLARFAETNTDGPTDFPDPHERIRFWDAYLAETAKVEDDWLPIAYPTEFDQGICSAILGAPIQYLLNTRDGWISSMCSPILNDMKDIDSLKIDPDAEILKLLDHECRVFSEAARGKFGIAPFIVIDAMNFVAEVRGFSRALEDVLDYPEEVVRLMDFAFDMNVFVQDRVRSLIEGFQGGSFVNFCSWVPGDAVLFSVDFYHLARPDYYYKWGEPHIQKLLDYYQGGVLHLHSNGRHLLPHVTRLRHLTCIFLIDETGNPRSYDELSKLQKDAGDIPLIVCCEYHEFERDLDAHQLPGNVLYQVANVPSVSEANRLMGKVRRYRLSPG